MAVTTLLAFVFVLGVLVFVHELGHFLAAKRVGIRVLKFQLGFNPTILSFRRGDTEYGIGALPLGGYVKMAGENPEDVSATGRSADEFLSKTKWQRFQVLIMGPVDEPAAGGRAHGRRAVSGRRSAGLRGSAGRRRRRSPTDSPAAKAGHPAGDRIVVGRRTAASTPGSSSTWRSARKPNREIAIGLLRDGREHDAHGDADGRPARAGSRSATSACCPNVHPHVASVTPASRPTRRPEAGRRRSSPSTASRSRSDAVAGGDREASRAADHAVDSARRQPMTITVTPAQAAATSAGSASASPTTRSSIKPGVGRSGQAERRRRTSRCRGLIFQTSGASFTRETSPKQLMGPVAIAQLSGESAQLGWIALFSLMASISLNLGLLNLLPIPVLDGGHIFIMALEGLARRDFSMRVKEKMLLAGFVGPDDADGDSHLQRSDAHQLDRTPDALALGQRHRGARIALPRSTGGSRAIDEIRYPHWSWRWRSPPAPRRPPPRSR